MKNVFIARIESNHRENWIYKYFFFVCLVCLFLNVAILYSFSLSLALFILVLSFHKTREKGREKERWLTMEIMNSLDWMHAILDIWREKPKTSRLMVCAFLFLVCSNAHPFIFCHQHSIRTKHSLPSKLIPSSITGAKKIIQVILVDFSPIFCIINFFLLSLSLWMCVFYSLFSQLRCTLRAGTFVFCKGFFPLAGCVVAPMWGF